MIKPVAGRVRGRLTQPSMRLGAAGVTVGAAVALLGACAPSTRPVAQQEPVPQGTVTVTAPAQQQQGPVIVQPTVVVPQQPRVTQTVVVPGGGGYDYPDYSGDTRTIHTPTGEGIYVRSGPSSGDSEVTLLPNGSSVHITCDTSGETIRGDSQWDHIDSPAGGYIADAYVDGVPSVPSC